MISISISTPKHRAPFFSGARTGRSPPAPAFLRFRRPIPVSSLQQNPGRGGSPSSAGGSTVPSQVPFFQSQTRPVQNPIPELYPQKRKKRSCNTSVGGHVESQQQMWVLCRFGYWVQGFRCFPWLALNLHLVHGLGLSPSTLQLVQNISNVPMVAKPFCGLLSDALYIGGARRLPYISCGDNLMDLLEKISASNESYGKSVIVALVMSWGTLCLIPITGDTFPTQMACILLGNLGASFTEVVSDALVAEFSKAQKEGILQSYAFMALAAGGILGNLSGGFVLLRAQQPKFMFFTFALLLIIQLGLSLTAKEDTFYMPSNSNLEFMHCSMLESLSKRFSDLVTSINEESICHPLSWIVASIAVVPLLSGTIFCFQTQFLKLDPAIIGLSKVIGQLMVLAATFIYNRYLKRIPFRRLVFWLQIVYALSLLSDLCLVKQINLKLGISNEIYVLCLSALAEAVAQFKILPFSVLLARLCPPGCEGSVFAFFASALCLSSILSGIFGVGLASLIGVTSSDYSGLSVGIILQFMAALIPLGWISRLPIMETSGKVKRGRKGFSVG